MRLSEEHAKYFKQLSLEKDQFQYFTKLMQQSWKQQQAIEAADNLSFPEYLARYFAQR
jgi:glutamate--cysteine ligase